MLGRCDCDGWRAYVEGEGGFEIFGGFFERAGEAIFGGLSFVKEFPTVVYVFFAEFAGDGGVVPEVRELVVLYDGVDVGEVYIVCVGENFFGGLKSDVFCEVVLCEDFLAGKGGEICEVVGVPFRGDIGIEKGQVDIGVCLGEFYCGGVCEP